MPRFTDEAVCVRSQEWSETSQLVVLITRQRGKVRGLAKGSRRQSPGAVARFSGGIGLLTRGQVIATTRRTGLASVTEWDLQASYPALRQDLSAWRAAMAAADATDALLAEEDPCEAVHAALVRLLEAVRHGRIEQALLAYFWELLGETGIRPELSLDASTGGPLAQSKTYAFSPDAGGLVQTPAVADWKVRAETIHRLRQLNTPDTARESSPETDHRANRLLLAYLRHHLGRQLPTMGWWLDAKTDSALTPAGSSAR